MECAAELWCLLCRLRVLCRTHAPCVARRKASPLVGGAGNPAQGMNQWLSRVDKHGDMCDDWEAGLRQSEAARRATPAAPDQGPAAGLAGAAAQEALPAPSAEAAGPSSHDGGQQQGAAISRGAGDSPAASGAAPQPAAAAGRDLSGVLPKKPPEPVSAGFGQPSVCHAGCTECDALPGAVRVRTTRSSWQCP